MGIAAPVNTPIRGILRLAAPKCIKCTQPSGDWSASDHEVGHHGEEGQVEPITQPGLGPRFPRGLVLSGLVVR